MRAPSIYVEPGADEVTRIRLRESMEQAESSIRAAYGDVASRPTVNACITEGCYEAFGGGCLGEGLRKTHPTFVPRALNWHLLAHEWSHAEMSTRLTFFAWKRMPQWFDEGAWW